MFFFFFLLSYTFSLRCDVSLSDVLIQPVINSDGIKLAVLCNDEENNLIHPSDESITLTGKTTKHTIGIRNTTPKKLEKVPLVFDKLSISLETTDTPFKIEGEAIVVIDVLNECEISIETSSSSKSLHLIDVSQNSEVYINGISEESALDLSLKVHKGERNGFMIGGNLTTIIFNSIKIEAKSDVGGLLGQHVNFLSSKVYIEAFNDSIGGAICSTIQILRGSNIYSKSEKGASIGKSLHRSDMNITISDSTVESHSKSDGPAIGIRSDSGIMHIINSNIFASSEGFYSAVGGCGSITIESSNVSADSILGTPLGGPGLERYYPIIKITIIGSIIEAHTNPHITCRSSAIGGGISDQVYINITSSTVNATSNYFGSAIGNGILTISAFIFIDRSTVFARALGSESSAIGGGSQGRIDKIQITNSNVIAYSGLGAAAIGSSLSQFLRDTIVIENSTIKAYSDLSGAAIGGAASSTAIKLIKIVNCDVEAIAGGQSPLISEGSAIGGGSQSISTENMYFGNLYIENSTIRAVSNGYGAAIGGGYNQGIGNISIINCKVQAITKNNNVEYEFIENFNNIDDAFDSSKNKGKENHIFFNFYKKSITDSHHQSIKDALPYENSNMGPGIGSGSTATFPNNKRYYNVKGNITFIDSKVIAIGGSMPSLHTDNLQLFRAGSGIGFGGIGTHTNGTEDENFNISIINSQVLAIGGNATDESAVPGPAIGGTLHDDNVAFKILLVDNSTVVAINGKSELKKIHGTIGFATDKNSKGKIVIKNKSNFTVKHHLGDNYSIPISIKSIEVGSQSEIELASNNDCMLNVQNQKIDVPSLLLQNLSKKSIKRIIVREFPNDNNVIYERIVNVENINHIFLTVPSSGKYQILAKNDTSIDTEYFVGNSTFYNLDANEGLLTIEEIILYEIDSLLTTSGNDDGGDENGDNENRKNKRRVTAIVAIVASVVIMVVAFAIAAVFVVRNHKKIVKAEKIKNVDDREAELINQENESGETP